MLIDLIRKVDTAPYSHEKGYKKFCDETYSFVAHDGVQQLGYLIEPVVVELENHPEVVTVDRHSRTVRMSPSLDTLFKRTDAFMKVACCWKEKKAFEVLLGWRDENYTVFYPTRTPYMFLERAVSILLGVVTYGVHINGFVENDGDLKLWIPSRSPTKATYPGMLDNTVAGGLGYPYGVAETCIKECYEEAGLDGDFVKANIQSAGVLSYIYQHRPGSYDSEECVLQPEVEYIYDLNMRDQVPHPVDFEAENFKLLSVDQVMEKLLQGRFKPNCAAVLIDFLIRRGVIEPETEPDYLEMVSKIHRKMPFPTR